tara:strand:- start:4096 stop:5955 length:1860 start_codon:yes stop_codon:yes gene_type:complete
MTNKIQKQLKKVRNKSYLARDFESFRSELLEYARTYFPDKINDFSDASVGGLFLDMAAFVGDSMSFYLDHQFNELFPSTSVEQQNILRHLREAGVPITTVSPAVTTIRVSVDVAAVMLANGEYQPSMSALPIIGASTAFIAQNGVGFVLIEEIDFTKTGPTGELLADVEILQTALKDTDAVPAAYRIYAEGIAISGIEASETFSIPNVLVPFREIVLSSPDVTDVISITDSQNNVYYEVNSLTQNIVYGGSPNYDSQNNLVSTNMELVPAPYRFIKIVDPGTRLTSVQFGAGDAEVLDNDIIPDASELALPLYGKKTMARFAIDPNDIMGTHTLGIAPKNTVISIRYRHGGGITHNVGPNSILNIADLKIRFPSLISPEVSELTRASIQVTNPAAAGGGLPAPTLDELKLKVPAMRQMQSRVVSAQDLLARIYTMAPRYGRVYRASISDNPNNPMAAILHVLCKDQDNNLTIAPDALKKNLRKYLNEYRLISDAIDIVDAAVINIRVEFSIVTHPTANKNTVIQVAINNIVDLMKISNFQIGQPIIIADIINVIINTNGVISLIEMPRVSCIYKSNDGRKYSNYSFDVNTNIKRGLIVPPPSAMFELKYPEFDIVGNAS